MFQSLPPLTRGLIIAFIAAFVFRLLLHTTIDTWLPVFGLDVFPGLQLWRVATYPFVIGLWDLISIGVILYFFGSELEIIIHTKKLSLFFAALILLGGLIFSLLAPAGVLAGPEILSIFILAGFTYLWPRREISIFGMFAVQTWIIALIFLVLALLPSNGTQMDTSASKVFAPLFGTLFGLILFHLTFRQYKFGRTLLAKVGRSRPPESDWSNGANVQHRVDQILDKISTKGMASLSKEEKEFLLNHSGK